MTDHDSQVVSELRRRLQDTLPNVVCRLMVYGSRARGDADDDSDLDLLAIVEPRTEALDQTLNDIAYAVMWDFDFQPVISLKVFSESAFASAVERGLSFYVRAEAEGVAV